MAEQVSVTADSVTNVVNGTGATDKIISFIQQQITSVAGAIKEYGPVAAHDVGLVKQWEAIGHLITNTFIILFLLILFYICSKSWKKITESYEKLGNNAALGDAGFVFRFFITVLFTISVCGGGIGFIASIYNANTYYLMDAISPNIAFAHFVMDRVSDVMVH